MRISLLIFGFVLGVGALAHLWFWLWFDFGFWGPPQLPFWPGLVDGEAAYDKVLIEMHIYIAAVALFAVMMGRYARLRKSQ